MPAHLPELRLLSNPGGPKTPTQAPRLYFSPNPQKLVGDTFDLPSDPICGSYRFSELVGGRGHTSAKAGSAASKSVPMRPGVYLPAANGLSGRVAWCHQHPCYTSPEPQRTEVTSIEGAMQGRPSGSLFCRPSLAPPSSANVPGKGCPP